MAVATPDHAMTSERFTADPYGDAFTQSPSPFEFQIFVLSATSSNGRAVRNSSGVITVMDDGHVPADVVACARVGLSKNAESPLRFLVAGNPHVSRKP